MGIRWRDEQADDFAATIDTAAERLAISALAVEKDYWVCEALRAIAAQQPNRVIFKGGTSLEKLRLIQRFSEDLDLLIIDADTSSKELMMSTKALMKSLCQAAAAATGGSLTDERSGGQQGWFWRHAYLQTPQLDRGTVPGIADAGRILLELGETGGPNPHSLQQIESLLSRELAQVDVDVHAYDDLKPFEVRILAPVRTLMEKLLRVNNFPSNEGGDDGWPRIGRQLYDIYALLGDKDTLADLDDRNLILGIVEDARRVSAQIGRPDAAPPIGGFAESVIFKPEYEYATRIAHEHEKAMASLYYGTEPPSFDTVLKRVSDNRNSLDPYT